jgi:molybdopterin molybdotransferase
MISVEDAKTLILQTVTPLEAITLELDNASNYVLAEDVFSPVDMPLFNQSAMDGYAVAAGSDNNFFKVVGEVQAGKYFPEILKIGEAVRIFTGAPVPEGAIAVVMQEKTNRTGESISFTEYFSENENIRFQGEQIKKGECALRKGTLINPAAIGFLASLGIGNVKVYKKPSVAILVTGDELQMPGSHLAQGMIYESNSVMIKSAFEKLGLENVVVKMVRDNETTLITAVSEAIEKVDAVIMSGGISVGDYDFSGKALNAAGVENIFYKITQKPGKPLYYGKKGNKLIFALPGNPAAALSCFYEYVYPSLNLLMGKSSPFLLNFNLPLKSEYTKKSGLALFLKGFAGSEGVEILEGQGSHILKSFAESNCLIYLSASQNQVSRGELVEVHLLPV